MQKLVTFSLLALSLSACGVRGDGSYRRSDLGTVAGAVVGTVVGSTIGKGSGNDIAKFGGALYGGVIGNEWGRAVDRYQLQNKTRTSDGAFEYLPDNTYKAWINPNTGTKSTIEPLGSVVPANSQQTNQNCRLFETTRSGSGNAYSAIGMVCRDSYGRWRLVD
jgi:surface antigen